MMTTRYRQVGDVFINIKGNGCPEGYEQEIGNPCICLIALSPCVWREQTIEKTRCCTRQRIVCRRRISAQSKGYVIRSQCRDCKEDHGAY